MGRIVGLLAGGLLLTSACSQAGRGPVAQPDATPPVPLPVEMPSGLLVPRAADGVVLPPEFDLSAAHGFRTVAAGVGTDGASRDSWQLFGDRLATLWRDDAGAEYLTALTLGGEPVWHIELSGLLDPAGERPVQPILERLRTADGTDWLVVTNPGSTQPGGPLATRVLTVDAGTGALGADWTFSSDRIGVGVGAGHLSVVAYDETYEDYFTLLLDPRSGDQQRFDNPETRTGSFHFIDSVTGFYDGEPIYRRGCLQILSRGASARRR